MAANPRRRRRRHTYHPRRKSYRRRRHNPSMGLNLKYAIGGAAGGALASYLANQVERMSGKVLDAKIKGAVVLGIGALLGGAKFIPSSYRGPLSIGAQIVGANKILSTVAPSYFSGIEGVDPLNVQIPSFNVQTPGGLAVDYADELIGGAWPENG